MPIDLLDYKSATAQHGQKEGAEEEEKSVNVALIHPDGNSHCDKSIFGGTQVVTDDNCTVQPLEYQGKARRFSFFFFFFFSSSLYNSQGMKMERQFWRDMFPATAELCVRRAMTPIPADYSVVRDMLSLAGAVIYT